MSAKSQVKVTTPNTINKSLDQEVSSIFEDASNNKSTIGGSIKLEANKNYKVCISHIVSINEFWVQATENLYALLENQTRIAHLVDTYKPTINAPHSYEVGDFVLGRYSVDEQWYKGIVVSSNDQIHEVTELKSILNEI